ncbi:cytochrome P450 [Cristinia sonorae]|uniref:Cytochrome P450 n=1 Tax=Cristinia sonorae TaxID=1940300 RepID=A0A8K0XNV8_9AGAR|nr:cytochrome P450 [Cristinia sonorae]
MTTARLILTAVFCLLLTRLWTVVSRYLFAGPLDNLPGPARSSWYAGNLNQIFNRHGWGFQDELLDQYAPVVKLHGLLGRKMLYVYDPTALYQVVIKDSYTFEPVKWFTSFVSLVFGPGLPAVHGEQHRKQRKLINPAFSGAFIRNLTPMFYDVAHKMRTSLQEELTGGVKEINILPWIHRAALEAVGRGALGHTLDPLNAPSSDEYGNALKAVSPVVFSLGYLRMLSPLLSLLTTPVRRFLVRFVPHAGVREMARLARVMDDKAKEIFRLKSVALMDDRTANRTDQSIMSVLMRANMAASPEDRLPEDELIGQMSTLAFAGTDTTTSAIAQIIDLLSRHPDVQERLRRETTAARDRWHGATGSDDLTYDALMSLPYLDAVCRETLRLYPPATFVYRETGKDTTLPLSKPIRGVDGTLLHEIIVPKGTTILLGIRGCNLNRDIWGPDAREWRPERWLSPLPESLKNAKIPGVYSNIMTFLGGGRSCIGFKFSQLEMKVLLFTLVTLFRFKQSRQIYWNLCTFVYPTAGPDSSTQEMPVIVEPLTSAQSG